MFYFETLDFFVCQALQGKGTNYNKLNIIITIQNWIENAFWIRIQFLNLNRAGKQEAEEAELLIESSSSRRGR